MRARSRSGWPRLAAGLLCLSLAACSDTPSDLGAGLDAGLDADLEAGLDAGRATGGAAPQYLGIETRLLDGDLVNFIVEMRGGAQPRDVEDYARCAAAQYTLIRGYGFARQVRTSADVEGSLWRADAVYTISPSLPRGAQTIDAEVTVADCVSRGIPTV